VGAKKNRRVSKSFRLKTKNQVEKKEAHSRRGGSPLTKKKNEVGGKRRT